MAPTTIILLGLTLLALGLLVWFGRAPERIAAMGFLALMLGSPLIQDLEVGNLRVGVATLSVSLLVLLITLALSVRRWWLLAAAGLQLAVVGSYLMALANPDILIWSGITLRHFLWIELMFACLFGAWEARTLRRSALTEKMI